MICMCVTNCWLYVSISFPAFIIKSQQTRKQDATKNYSHCALTWEKCKSGSWQRRQRRQPSRDSPADRAGKNYQVVLAKLPTKLPISIRSPHFRGIYPLILHKYTIKLVILVIFLGKGGSGEAKIQSPSTSNPQT
jgi:hypothetical protein